MAAKQSSLERIFILPFVLLMLCLASTVAWTLYRSAEQAVDTISKTVLGKAAHHLRNTVQDHFSHARLTLNAIAFDSILQQGTSSSDFRFSSALFDIKDQLWTALKLFPESGRRVFFCSKEGQYVGISRIDSQQYEIGLRISGNEKWTIYSSKGRGISAKPSGRRLMIRGISDGIGWQLATTVKSGMRTTPIRK